MIVLELGLNQDIPLTLTELSTLPSPDYIFIFVSDETKHAVACTATDNSINPSRYNSFDITVVAGAANPLLGEVKLTHSGFYHYYIQEVADASIYNYGNIDNVDLDTLTFVEKGKMRYITTETDVPTFEGGQVKYPVFNG